MNPLTNLLSLQNSTYTGLFILSFIATTLTAIWGGINRNQRAGIEFFALSVLGVILSTISGVQSLVTTISFSILLGLLSELVTPLIVMLWFVFALSYSGRRHYLNKYVYAFIGLELFGFYLLFLLSGYYPILFSQVEFTMTPYSTAIFHYTTIHTVHSLFMYGLVSISILMLFRTIVISRPIHYGQLFSLLFATFIPLSLHLAAKYGPLPNGVNFLSFGVAIFVVITAIALYRYQLVDLAPVARNRVLDKLSDGIIVLNTNQKILEYNDSAESVLSNSDTSLSIGAEWEEVTPDDFQTMEFFSKDTDLTNTVTLGTPPCEKHYTIRSIPIHEDNSLTGWVVKFRDVTPLKENQTELERQNQQLEHFASAISHDLRNPLNVSQAYLSIAKDSGGDDAFETINTSHRRMERIIDDVLLLTRQGKAVDETEPVPLVDLVQNAWETVETGDAALHTDFNTDIEIEVDLGRASNIFENLYRNAREHGDASIIRVGVTESGFYIEDNGPGIPPEKHDLIFEHGHTTNEDGTGFGLSIVQTIANGHGWTVSVEEGTDGGARFHFKNVELHTTVGPSVSGTSISG